jgi:hypothetical protein
MSWQAISPTVGHRCCRGGKAVLFTSNITTGSYEDAEIVVYSLSSGQRKMILTGLLMEGVELNH